VSLSSGVRLNKFISDSGHCSRREADKLIESNRVKINGKRPEMGVRVEDGDEVTVDGFQIYGSAANKSDRVYLAYNKPVGITCTTEQNVKGNIVDAVDHDERIFPIGRLDKPSDGLILLTSDGDIVNKILRAENAHDKEYLVTVNKPIGPGFAEKMSSGIPILDTVTKPCKVKVQGKSSFKIILTQGLNRQIRRMCEYLGYEVKTLTRLRIMNIELGKLRPGQWRKLSREEMEQLNSAISTSSSESTAKPKRSRSRPGKPGQHQASARKKPYSGKGANDEHRGDKNKSRKKSAGTTSPKSKGKAGAKPAKFKGGKPSSRQGDNKTAGKGRPPKRK
jgi:pseudouridine synthase